jgi:MerR family transcriptional regulator, thiopeptide resistance regulator
MSDARHETWEAEARERWGNTEAYRESARRMKGYTKDDLARIEAERDGIEAGFAAALADGDAPEGERATGLAEQARLHIDRWFYPCSHGMHRGLADMYVADARFRAHYDDRAAGLAECVAAAIRANAASASG